MTTLLRIFYAVLVAGLLVVAYQFTERNPETVSVRMFDWSSSPQPLWLLLLAAFGVGFALAALLFGTRLVRSSLVARRYRRVVSSLEAEVHQLRNVPLAEPPVVATPGAEPSAGARRG